MIGVSSLDLLAFPVRFTQPADRRRSSTPAGARCSPPSTARCPGGVQRARPSRSVGSPDDLASELLAAGRGVPARRRRRRCATRDGFDELDRRRDRRAAASPTRRPRRSCSWPTPGPCARSSSHPWELAAALPAQARRRDQLDDAGAGADGARGQSTNQQDARGASSRPMRRRHLRSVLRIEAPGVPAAVVARAVPERARPLRTSRVYLVARVGGDGRRLRRADAHRRRRPRHHHRRRPGVAPPRASAPGCCSSLARQAVDRGRARTSRSRCGCRNDAAQALYRRFGFAPAGRPQELLRRDQRGRARDVGPRHRRARRTPSGSTRIEAAHARARRSSRAWRDDRRPATDVILGIETSCDETAAAVVVDGTRRAVVGGVEPGRPARPLRRRRARDRQPGPRRAAHPGGRRGAGRGGRRRTPTSTPWPPPSGPGLVGSLLVGVSARPRRWRSCGTCRSSASTTSRPTSTPRFLEEPDLELPARRAARVGRPHDARRTWRTTAATGCSARPSTTPPARRSTRSPATSASATRAGRPSTASPIEGDPTPSRFPRAMLDEGYDFSLLRAEDRGDQPRPQAPRRAPPPTWPPRSRRRWSTCS